MKKMKKRRELDALVNGKTGRKKTNGHHELLRGESESSDVEEFSIPEQTVVRKRSARTSRFCVACLMGCGIFLLLACMVAIIGLVWVHVELKRNVDLLQANIRRLDSGSQSNPEEFQELHSSQQKLEATLNDIQNGENGLSSLLVKITSALKQISVLNVTTLSLSKSLATAPQLKKLPDIVQSLEKETADMGSNLHGLQEDVSSIQTLKSGLTKEVEDLAAKVDTLIESRDNETVLREEENHTDNLSVFQKKLDQLDQRVKTLNITSSAGTNDAKETSEIRIKQGELEEMIHLVQPRIDQLEKDIQELKEADRLNALHNSASHIQTDEKSTTTTKITGDAVDGEKVTTSKSDNVVQDNYDASNSSNAENVKVGIFQVPWVKNQEDAYTNFLRWDKDGDGKVVFDDLSTFLGPNVPKEEDLKKYDSDLDGRYNLDEIMSAFGFSKFNSTTQQPDTITPKNENVGGKKPVTRAP